MCTYFILQYKHRTILADDLEPMMTTLQTALAPLLIFGSFFGLSFFEYHGHSIPLILYLSCSYVLTIWGLIMYFVYYPIIFVRLFENPNLIFDYWMDLVILITAIISILVSWFHFKVKVLYVFNMY